METGKNLGFYSASCWVGCWLRRQRTVIPTQNQSEIDSSSPGVTRPPFLYKASNSLRETILPISTFLFLLSKIPNPKIQKKIQKNRNNEKIIPSLTNLSLESDDFWLRPNLTKWPSERGRNTIRLTRYCPRLITDCATNHSDTFSNWMAIPKQPVGCFKFRPTSSGPRSLRTLRTINSQKMNFYSKTVSVLYLVIRSRWDFQFSKW